MKNTFWNLHYGTSHTDQASHTAAEPHQLEQHDQSTQLRHLSNHQGTGFNLPPSDWGLSLNFVGCSFGPTVSGSANTTVSSSSNAVSTSPTDQHKQSSHGGGNAPESVSGTQIASKGAKGITNRELTVDMTQIAQDFTGTWMVEATGQGALLQPQDLYTAFKDSRGSRSRRHQSAGTEPGSGGLSTGQEVHQEPYPPTT